MNIFKKITTLVLTLCLIFCVVGCAEKYEKYDNFKPTGVYIVDCINGTQYKIDIDDAVYAQIMLDEFKKLDVNTSVEGEIDSSYLYLRFYNEDQSTFIIFTIYENGSCCLGEEFQDFYTVTGGRQAYIDLCNLYESYEG